MPRRIDNIKGVGVTSSWPLPPIAHSCCGPAIVCGTAPGFEEEFGLALELLPNAYVMGVNYAHTKIPVDALTTVHPEIFNKLPIDLHTDKPGGDWRWPIVTRGGTSALLAVCVCIVMGFKPVCVAGVHLDGDYKIARGRWVRMQNQLCGKIFSVSPEGTFLRDIFGGL